MVASELLHYGLVEVETKGDSYKIVKSDGSLVCKEFDFRPWSKLNWYSKNVFFDNEKINVLKDPEKLFKSKEIVEKILTDLEKES